MSERAFFAYTLAVALAFGLVGGMLGFASSYATARIASYRLPADCSYLRGGVVICLFPEANRKRPGAASDRPF